MAIRDTQDALVVEQPNPSAKVLDTQDVLILEGPAGALGPTGHLRDTQDALHVELGDSVRLQKINQLPQLFQLFLVYHHSSRARSEEHTSELQSLRHLVCR